MRARSIRCYARPARSLPFVLKPDTLYRTAGSTEATPRPVSASPDATSAGNWPGWVLASTSRPLLYDGCLPAGGQSKQTGSAESTDAVLTKVNLKVALLTRRQRELLEARHVTVSGGIDVRHRPLGWADDAAHRSGAPPMRPPAQPVLAKLTPPPLSEDLVHTMKVSQNLHAELFLRRVSLKDGSGSVSDGLAVERAMLERAGVARVAYDFADGSGMSSYNRIAPRSAVALLRWIATQPWGEQWRATLPIAA